MLLLLAACLGGHVLLKTMSFAGAASPNVRHSLFPQSALSKVAHFQFVHL